jgi:hypothetical protein
MTAARAGVVKQTINAERMQAINACGGRDAKNMNEAPGETPLRLPVPNGDPLERCLFYFALERAWRETANKP